MKHNNLFNLAKVLTFLIILILGLFPASMVSAEETTIVSVSAPSEVDAGEQFTISIAVEPGTAIAGAQFDLSFDQSLVTADSVAEGNLLSQNGAATYFNTGVISNTTGTISRVAGAIITPGQTVSTPGTFTTITLTAGTTGGTCPLILSGVVVGDSDGQSVPVNVISGQVIINSQDTTNQPPVLNPIGDKSVNEGQLLMFTVSATDPDDDPLTFSASGLPQGANFNPETRTFSWTPGPGTAGTYGNVRFEVSDGELTDSESITITVLSLGNNAPVLSPIGNKSVNETELLEFTISATDPDDDPLTFSADNLPTGASFEPETRTFYWTPTSGQAGTYPNVHFTVSDGELTDYEDITITVNIPTPPDGGGGGGTGGADAGGGGGGGVGGGPEPSDGEPDEAPPVIQGVAASVPTTDSVEIRWTTTEPSTSQVEYWASPSQFSPLDETLVTEHVVRLTNLTPDTNYHYRTLSQDEAGNLSTSPEYSFTTPGNPATLAVRWLSISPAEADIGEEVTISVLVTNTGDVTGSYDVTLSINGAVEATEQVVDLASGASQEVAFAVTKETAGVYTVSVNGTTGSLVVGEADLLESTITLFKIRPIYEADTGVITFIRIDCQINEAYHSMLFSQLGAELVLKVGLDDEPLEEVILISPEQSEPTMSIDGLNYVPAEGWKAGIYTFQAELRTGDGVVETSPAEELVITAAAAAGVASWATLGEIIGGVLIIALFAMLFILYRNRDMLRA